MHLVPRERFANLLVSFLQVDQFPVGAIAGALPGWDGSREEPLIVENSNEGGNLEHGDAQQDCQGAGHEANPPEFPGSWEKGNNESPDCGVKHDD